MAFPDTGGSYFEPNAQLTEGQTPERITYYQGTSIGVAATDTNLITAIGTLTADDKFHLTRAVVSMSDYTTTATYDLLLTGQTVASFFEKGTHILNFGANGILGEGIATAAVQLAMECVTKTGTVARVSVIGYKEA